MKEIRYFGTLVDPAVYRRGFGFLGWFINVMNVVRAWLEKKTVLAILRIECRRAGLTPTETKNVVRQAAIHPDFVPVLDQSLPRYVRKLMRDHYPAAYQTLEERTKARYGEGRKNHDKDGPPRPIPFEEGFRNTFAQYNRRNDRSMRYVSGRKILIDYEEPEDQNE